MLAQNPRPSHTLKSALTRQAVGAVISAVCFVGSVHAVGVGALKGQAVIGRTLDVSVPVQLDDASEGVANACVQHSVFFGDSKVDARRTTGAWTDRSAKAEGVFRITTTTVVNEPVVSVEVRAGCTQTVTRRFELLADAPAAPAAAEPVVVSGAQSVSTAPTAKKSPLPPVSTGVISLATPVEGAAPRPAKATHRVTGSVTPVKAKAPAIPMRRTTGVVIEAVTPDGVTASTDDVAKLPPAMDIRPPSTDEAGSRLKVDALSEWAAGLKSTAVLNSTPATSDQARQEAQAMWRSLNGVDANDAKRVQTLEAELKALKADGKKSQQAQDALRSELDRAQQAQYVNPVVGGLAALLLSALAVLVYMYMRKRNGTGGDSKWWHSKDSFGAVMEGTAMPAENAKVTRPRSKLRSRVSVLPNAAPTAPASRIGAGPSGFQHSAPPVSQPPTSSAFPASTGGARSRFMQSMMGTRAVSVDELFDIQQQAEFFVSLGQHDQAIELLRHHIFAATGTSGLAYLDLLEIYHQLGRKDEYEELRQEFNRDFRANVPAFENYSQQGRGIERYTPLISRIVEAWGSRVVLDEIEQLIFRKPSPGAHQGEDAFDLNAYRELMLLYAIAKDLLGESGEELPMQPESSESLPAEGALPRPTTNASRDPMASGYPPVKIDLGEPLGSTGSVSQAGGATAFGSLPTQVNTAISLPKGSQNLGLDVDLAALETAAPVAPPPMPAMNTGKPDVDFDALGVFGDDKPAAPVPDLNFDDLTLDIPQKPANPVLETSPALVPKSSAQTPSVDLDVSNLFSEDAGALPPVDAPSTKTRATKKRPS